ncbi:MAG TPA: alanine racemase [Usitatibacter sp.]|nr:alanine racemase [Usitatibacter sp.]
MSRPVHATISHSALRHNYALAKISAPHAKVLAVVKANAYGHGLERVARALPNADGFATLEIDGAVALRNGGVEGTILLLEGFFEPSELRAIQSADLATVVHSEEQLRMLELDKPTQPIDVWFKINTGMNRLGFPVAAARDALERLERIGVTRSITLMTHFANADQADGVEEALRRFNEATRGIALPRSLANSAAIFAHPDTHGDCVRQGITLYGATPFLDRPAKSLGLRPAMRFASELIAIRDLEPGDCVGYGSDFRCEVPMRIGVVACGYADGYPRHAPSGTPILVAGGRTKLAGRVSMDMITVDLRPVPEARVGSPVVMWGEGIPVDEVAMAAGTVGYELLCAVAPRVRVADVDAL